MPFRLPLKIPYLYNYRRNYFPYFNKQNIHPKHINPEIIPNTFINSQTNKSKKINSFTQEKSENFSNKNNKKNTEDKKNLSSEYFFEIFGFHFYFDDILILCILLFLYVEEVKDIELFLCLIFLLLS